LDQASQDTLWTAKDVANYLKVSRSWVYQHVGAGDLPYQRVGGLLRFAPEAVQAYACGQRPSASPVISFRRPSLSDDPGKG